MKYIYNLLKTNHLKVQKKIFHYACSRYLCLSTYYSETRYNNVISDFRKKIIFLRNHYLLWILNVRNVLYFIEVCIYIYRIHLIILQHNYRRKMITNTREAVLYFIRFVYICRYIASTTTLFELKCHSKILKRGSLHKMVTQ